MSNSRNMDTFRPSLPPLDAYGYYYSHNDDSVSHDRSLFGTANIPADQLFIIPPPGRPPIPIVAEAGGKKTALKKTPSSVSAPLPKKSPALDDERQKPLMMSSRDHLASTSAQGPRGLSSDMHHATSSYMGSQLGSRLSQGHSLEDHVEKPFILPSPHRRPLTITKPADSSQSQYKGLDCLAESTKPQKPEMSLRLGHSFANVAQDQTRAPSEDHALSNIGLKDSSLPIPPLRSSYQTNPGTSKLLKTERIGQRGPHDREASARPSQRTGQGNDLSDGVKPISNSAAAKLLVMLRNQAIAESGRASLEASPPPSPDMQEILGRILAARDRSRYPGPNRVDPSTKPPNRPAPPKIRAPTSIQRDFYSDFDTDSDSTSTFQSPILTPRSSRPASPSPAPHTAIHREIAAEMEITGTIEG